jgi:GT2 family glycosyltransferase
MQLSVIIVNYNVKYFLEHCLLSVLRACDGIDAEVIVVDNLSKDGSVEMVKEKFPSVKLIDNKENVGFARGNNQAVAIAKGQYILYLNPDTIVPEDCFHKCLDYMNTHPEAGALGCRLIDGKGQFLPESKRGFPSAKVAFFKISGFSSIFKKSKFFNKYHLGYLPEFDINEVDVLVGCFMFCRKSVIDEVGSFDEEYFMYGEDIDLSYKISKGGFKNIYFPETTVIHYKGESTKKGSLNYVKMFYQAMIIFAKKHFKSSQKGMYVLLIQFAIYLRAILAFVTNLFSVIKLPLIDAIFLLGSLVVMKTLWIKNIKTETQYSSSLIAGFFLIYILIWIFSLYFNGAYDKPYKSSRVLRGMLIGGIITIAIYGLLPETIRFSRGITVLGALMGVLMILASRKLMQFLKIKSVEPDNSQNSQVMLIGNQQEEQEIRALLSQAFIEKNIVGTVSPYDIKEPFQLGLFSNTKPLSQLYKITEIIFAQGSLSFKQIIDSMQSCGVQLEYKIHSVGTDSIIGSNSKDTAGDLYTTEVVYQIATPISKRNKRLVDIVVSLLFILFSPLLIWFVTYKRSYFLNMFLILEGDKTFVGYHDRQFPPLKTHLLNVYPLINDFEIPLDNKEHLNWLYAKNYNAWEDVRIIWEKWRMM